MGLVGVPRTRALPMGARRVGLPRRRCLGPGVPRRLLCRRCLRSRRWCRPAHSGLPRPRPPSSQPNRFSRTSRAGRVSRFSRAGLVGQPNRASRVGRPIRGSLFSLAGRVCRGGVLLGGVPRGLMPGLRRPRVCRPARGQDHLPPRPVQGPRPGPSLQLRRHNRRPSAAPPGPPLGRPPVVPWGTLLAAVLVGAVPTPRPGQRRGPRPVRGPGPRPVRSLARPVLPPPVDARRPRIRSRPSWPPPAILSEMPS